MITVDLRIFENGPSGLQVRLVARGAAKSRREQIYIDVVQPALRQALVDAGSEVERQGLGAPLSEEFKAAVAGVLPEPLSESAVEIKFPGATGVAVSPPSEPRPPVFHEFVQALADEYRAIAAKHMEFDPVIGKESARTIGNLIDVLIERGQVFLTRQHEFIAYIKAKQQAATGQN